MTDSTPWVIAAPHRRELSARSFVSRPVALLLLLAGGPGALWGQHHDRGGSHRGNSTWGPALVGAGVVAGRSVGSGGNSDGQGQGQSEGGLARGIGSQASVSMSADIAVSEGFAGSDSVAGTGASGGGGGGGEGGEGPEAVVAAAANLWGRIAAAVNGGDWPTVAAELERLEHLAGSVPPGCFTA